MGMFDHLHSIVDRCKEVTSIDESQLSSAAGPAGAQQERIAKLQKELIGFFNDVNNINDATMAPINDAIAHLLILQGSDAWPGIWDTLLNSRDTRSYSADVQRTIACAVIRTVAFKLCQAEWSNPDNNTLTRISSFLAECAMCHSMPKLVNEASCAIAEVLQLQDNTSSANWGTTRKDDIEKTMKALLEALDHAIGSRGWRVAQSICECLAVITESSPLCVRSVKRELFPKLLDVLGAPTSPAAAKNVACGVIEHFLSTDKKDTLKQIPDLNEKTFNTLFDLSFQNFEPRKDWDTVLDESNETDINNIGEVAEGCLDRLSVALGHNKKFTDLILSRFAEGVKSSNWNVRRTAISCLMVASEGMGDRLQQVTVSSTILPSLLAALKDENKYVRRKAMNCIAQLYTDHAECMVHLPGCTNELVSALLDTLSGPNEVPTNASIALAAVGSIAEVVGDEDLHDDPPYDVVTTLQVLMKHFHRAELFFEKESAVKAVCEVVAAVKTPLRPLVDELMEFFQQLVTSDDPIAINAGTEGSTNLAASVGYDAFSVYAQDVLEYVMRELQAQGERSGAGDGSWNPFNERFTYLLRAWTCMAECTTFRAVPFLPAVIPIIMAPMKLDACVETSRMAPTQEAPTSFEEGTQCVMVVDPTNGTKELIVINTALVELCDRHLSIMMCTVETVFCNQEYFDGCEDLLHAMSKKALEFLNFDFVDSVRHGAGELLNMIVVALINYGTRASDMFVKIFVESIQPLLDQISTETDTSSILASIETAHHMINSVPRNATDMQSVDLRDFRAQLSSLERSKQHLFEEQEDVDDDDEDDDGNDGGGFVARTFSVGGVPKKRGRREE